MKKSNSAAVEEKKYNYEVVVTRAKEVKEGRVVFDATVNGVSVSGFVYIEYTTKEGNEGTMISFPSVKGKKKDENGKDVYYNTVWFPISNELKENIIKQLEDKIS